MSSFDKEILDVVRLHPDGINSTKLLEEVNENRKRLAKTYPQYRSHFKHNMSPNTFCDRLSYLITKSAIQKIVISHKNVVYRPSTRLDEQLAYGNTIVSLAMLLNLLNPGLGLIESIKSVEKMFPPKQELDIKKWRNLSASIGLLYKALSEVVPPSRTHELIRKTMAVGSAEAKPGEPLYFVMPAEK